MERESVSVSWRGGLFFWGWRWLWAERQWCLVIWPTIPFNPRTLMCPPLSTASLFRLFVSPLQTTFILATPRKCKTTWQWNYIPSCCSYRVTHMKAFKDLYIFFFIVMSGPGNTILTLSIWYLFVNAYETYIWWNKMHSWTTKVLKVLNVQLFSKLDTHVAEVDTHLTCT